MKQDHTALKEAHAAGKELQFNDPDTGWTNCKHPRWHEDCKYRIKPPLEVLLREEDERKSSNDGI